MSYLAEELGKLDGKQSVRVAATTNVVLNGAQQIDGVAVIAGDRVLVANQTLAKDNGLWIVTNGDWGRATDANSSAKVTPGLTVMVEEGTANGDSLWHLITNAPITLGTTALTFKMLAGRTGIAAGTYKSLTVDEYGRATAGANPETLAGFGIKDSYTKAEVEALIAKASALPVGSIVAFPVDAPPPGFLELDNSVQSSALYPDLSAYLGGKFNKGNEGVGNFRLPETRGEFLRGWDHGRGVDAGRGLGSWQADDNKSHIHGTTYDVIADIFMAGDVRRNYLQQYNGTDDVVTKASGGNEARPRNITVMWCIKAWNAPVNQGNIDVAALVKEVSRLGSAVPVGAVLAFPTGIVPPGFLELDGSVQSIATYPDLAAYLGTSYNKGNEGAGNFRLPESRGEFLRGWDHGRGVDGGRPIGSWQKGSLQSFDPSNVSPAVSGLWHNTASDAGLQDAHGLDPHNTTDYSVSNAVFTAGNTPVSAGALGVMRPRNLAVMWCIKAWNAPINQGNIDISALTAFAQQATEPNQGTAKLASQAQTDAGVDDKTIVTPKKLRWGFSMSKERVGYLMLPSWLGGVIIQWGTINAIAAGAQVSVTYPIAYPTAEIMTLVGNSSSAGSTSITSTLCVMYGGLTKFTVSAIGSSGQPNGPWISIGW
jgi:phage-related tail fiber protein